MKSIYKVAVIGGGIMGAELASLMIRQDMPVVVKEVSADLAERVRERICQRIDGWLERGKISESRAEQLKMLLSVSCSYDDLQDAELIIEAVPEILTLKQSIFRELSRNLPDAILASNTSSIPITLLSEGVENPEQMAGMHFFNPPTKMPLVELISSELTSANTVESLEVFANETLAKTSVRVKDRPGFLVNVLLGAYLTPAIKALEETDVSPEAVDVKAKSFGWPMGPFTLLDMMGVDLVKEVMNILFSAYGKRFTPSRLVNYMVANGRLGQKTGIGFYGGEETLEELLKKEFPNRTAGDAEKVFRAMMCSMVNESAVAVQGNIASVNDVETGCLFGLGFPQAEGGPLHYADKVGIAEITGDLGEDACDLLKEKAGQGETFFSGW